MGQPQNNLNWRSADGHVDAWLEYPRNKSGTCHIIEFWANPKRQGHGRRALEELRAQFREIVAISIGDEGNDNRPFWFKMAELGLVDVLFEFGGNCVWPKADKEGEAARAAPPST